MIPATVRSSSRHRIGYGLYEVTAGPRRELGRDGRESYVLADKLADDTFAKAKVETLCPARGRGPDEVVSRANHPLKGLGGGYGFEVPLLDGEHVTDDAGTGFVHTAPGHGLDDFGIWMDSGRLLRGAASTRSIPFPVDDAGFYTKDAPGFRWRARHR